MNNFINKSRILIVPVLFCFMASLAFAKSDATNGKGFWQKSTITTTVQKVDKKANEITLKGPEGKEVTLNVGKDVDLSNFKEGDSVKAEYFRSVGISVQKATKDQENKPFTVLESKTVSPAGVDIAGGALKQVKAIAKIKSVDKSNGEITIEGPKGQEITVKVPNKSMLDKVKEGENAVVEYTQAIATNLEKVK